MISVSGTRKITTPTQVPAPAPPPTAGSVVGLMRLPDGTVTNIVNADEVRAAVETPDAIVWVDLYLKAPEISALLKEVFHFHPLAIEDAENPASRVKVDEYPTFLVVVARVVSFCESTPDPYDLETANLTVFVTERIIVTTHMQPLPVIEELITRVKENPHLLERGPARMAHLVLDVAVDAYFPVLDQLDEFVDEIEQRVFGQFDEKLLQEIFKVKRLVISLRRYLAPQREVLSALTMRPSRFLTQDAQLYFRDVYDHMLRITDALDSYRDLLSSTLDSYLTQVSNRLGAVSKGLALVGALSVPFVVVAGVYGMNFDRIPLSHHPHGFEIMVAIQLALGAILVLTLKRLKWL